MKKEHIDNYAAIPQPSRESFGFLKDLCKPLTYHFRKGHGCYAGKTENCMAAGVRIINEFSSLQDFPETALISLRRVLRAKGIQETENGYSVYLTCNSALSEEEYQVSISAEKTILSASDCDGLRRSIYFFEDRIREAEGPSATEGVWQRKPFVCHRISRCFFGPTNRPPFYINELMNEVDYYPEEYLNKLAHEGINGLWLTIYFHDLPSSIFPDRGKNAEQQLHKLRKTVEKCARYGIKIYLFCSEPKLFGNAHFANSIDDAVQHPEVMGSQGAFRTFCTSAEAGKKYLRESVEYLFSGVPELGGLINIMLGEDNGSCVACQTRYENLSEQQKCPVCSKRDAAEIYHELAELFSSAMHKYNPKAEFIGWFYTPSQRDGSPFMHRLLHILEQWPDQATAMLNFESGGTSVQLGKKRIVFDYSLAYVGPSMLFAEAAQKTLHTAAKIQVGCSHEDASVPFMPVPENLFEKYHFMMGHGISTVMQCWYFGNYPGLMNKAAGELSFLPFPVSSQDFLADLARPDWGRDAAVAAEAWHHFSKAYRNFPSNLSFEWYGPLHHCIAWPLYLFPVDEPVSPSWILKNFPEVSGDRIGECLGFQHTLEEAMELCSAMSSEWQEGITLLESLRTSYKDDPDRLADIDLASAIGLQMKSTENLLRFYYLREDMLYYRRDHLARMMDIVKDEISNTKKMIQLCGCDCRLGYHSEAEGYLFYPEKLKARIALLEELLKEDFLNFDLNAAWIDEYTGKKPTGICAFLHKKGSGIEEKYHIANDISWSGIWDEGSISLWIQNAAGSDLTVELAPCRLWVPMRIHVCPDGTVELNHTVYSNIPEVESKISGKDLMLKISLHPFDGFRKPGFPMQFNIRGQDFFWCDPKAWPCRLQHADWNPAGSGWLYLLGEPI